MHVATPGQRKAQGHMKQKLLFLRTLSSEICTVLQEVSGWELNLSHLFAELSLPVPHDLLMVGVIYD